MESTKYYSWYKDAIFYEVHVRAFSDSGDPDGIGDFRGLASKIRLSAKFRNNSFMGAAILSLALKR